MISTKLTLTSGEQVTAYYIDENTKRLLDGILERWKNVVFDSQLKYTVQKLNQIIEELANDIYIPKMQAAIVDLLRNKDLTEAEIRETLIPKPQEITLNWVGFWRAWEDYRKCNVVVPISRGRGHAKLWHLSVRPEKTQ